MEKKKKLFYFKSSQSNYVIDIINITIKTIHITIIFFSILFIMPTPIFKVRRTE
jgi:hypothetical protein